MVLGNPYSIYLRGTIGSPWMPFHFSDFVPDSLKVRPPKDRTIQGQGKPCRRGMELRDYAFRI